MCMQFQTGSQVSTFVEAWSSVFLSSCKRGCRPPVQFNWVSVTFLEFATGVSVLPSCCELILGLTLESVQGNQALTQVKREIGVFSNCGTNPRVPLEFESETASS